MPPLTKPNFSRMIEKAISLISDKFDPFHGDFSEDSGTLSINLKGIGEYLFNKQPSTHQLWGSSPLTGPCRFDLVEDKWIHTRKKIDLEKYINEEINKINSI
uniref:Mitochondrial frataxin n=1 Tax=Nosema bombycis TaxID=27978 RepID=D7EYK2_NOSBO|nr:mitochondrial frataxin [Nosema bombycis]